MPPKSLTPQKRIRNPHALLNSNRQPLFLSRLIVVLGYHQYYLHLCA